MQFVGFPNVQNHDTVCRAGISFIRLDMLFLRLALWHFVSYCPGSLASFPSPTRSEETNDRLNGSL